MKQIRTLLLLPLLFAMTAGSIQAQERYLEEVFSDVQVTDSVVYGINWSIFPVIAGISPNPLQVPLYMDIYEPLGDTASERHLILHAITGTFFPAIVNGTFTGERTDSFNIELATRLAKRGYVVAVVQYRRGWNAVGSQIQQQKTILQAAYRGIQDMRNCVRYFRKTAAEDANPWRINTKKIVVGGTGTGGYMSFGAAYLKRFEQALVPKFIDFDSTPPEPFVDTVLLGDPYGLDTAVLNNPNFPSYSSDFTVGYAIGGALGDPSWVETGDPPFLGMQTWKDPAAPFKVGDVLAVDPGTSQPFPVIGGASGSHETLRRADSAGNQDVFKSIDFSVYNDPLIQSVAERADTINDGIAGLYPFVTPFTPGDAMCLGIGVPGDTLAQWVSPWHWFNEPVAEASWNFFYAAQIPPQITGEQAVCRNTRGGPNNAAFARTYVDTIVAFLTPRLHIALVNSINDFIPEKLVKVFPNPSNDRMIIQYEGLDTKPIEEVLVMDMTGRVVKRYQDLRSREVEIYKGNLTTGMYLLQIRVGERVANRKILFN